jgi:hypothetical protein
VSQVTANLRMLLPRSFTLKHCERYSLTESGGVGDEGGGRGEKGQVGVRRGVTTYWGWGRGEGGVGEGTIWSQNSFFPYGLYTHSAM